jgi:BlaI family transcriptional regulator, penicillinase repressor
MPRAPKPTDAELAILRVLWDKGPSTVRQVHEVLSSSRSLAYTTSLKTLQIMTEKSLVTREEVGRQHVYRAKYHERDTQRRLVGDLLDRAFGGSLPNLVMQALASQPATPEDLREIRRLLGAHRKSDKENPHD